MLKIGLMLLAAAAGLCGGQARGGGRAAAPAPSGVSDAQVDGENCRDYHLTTRPHNRKVVYYAPGRSWFVFYGLGRWQDRLGPAGYAKHVIVWRQSRDGTNFSALTPAVAGNGHSSSTDVILTGNRIYVLGYRRNYWQEKAGYLGLTVKEIAQRTGNASFSKPAYYMPGEVFRFDIAGEKLAEAGLGVALPGDAHVGTEGPFYGSITRDTNGHLWVAARATATSNGSFATWVARSKRPDDLREWEPHKVLFTSGTPGTHAPQVIALDGGRVACVLFVKPELMTMVFLYDPASGTWKEPHILGKGYESKRASAVFDPGSRRMHVVYTDEAGVARHRFWAAPYSVASWSPALDKPGVLVAEQAGTNPGDDDLSLSANLSRKPAPLALLHRGPDQHLHLKYYDGKNWSPKDVQVGLQDPTISCDEVSAVADFSHGLGFAYYCMWKDAATRKAKDWRGQVRFGLVKDVAALFAGK
jgi:hypothetical protein